MSQELLRGNHVSLTRNSMATSFSRPFAGISTNSDQNRIFIDVEPENHGKEEDEENDDSSAPLARDCGYSRPFLFLDMIWNLAFVALSAFVLLVTVRERPSTPLRLWVFGYALQCLLHVVFVWDEYQSRNLDDGFGDFDGGGGGGGQECYFPWMFLRSTFCHDSAIKKLESINTIISSVWWVVGLYWIVVGGQPLLLDSPRLYWLSVIFLAFDLFSMIFCISMACIIFLLLFCCIPILATFTYAMTIGDGASENDIRSLPKYLYRTQHAVGVFENEKQQEVSLTASKSSCISMVELVLHPEDSECCICLFKYIDGAELCTLPCNHHFHHKCITKWLRMNATCPLCKFNILRGDTLV